MAIRTWSVVVTIVVTGLAAGTTQAQTQGQAPTATIDVAGTAEVLVVPDEIVIRIGVRTLDMSLQKSKKENDDRVKRVLAIVKECQIAPEDLQTDQVSITLDYATEDAKRVFKGFSASTDIAIILRDVKKYDDVLSKVLDAGANNVYDVDFRTTELRKHRDEARRLALIAARDKARAMAAVLNQEVGRPLAIIDEGAAEAFSSGAFSNVQTNYLFGGGGDSDENTTIALGRIKISSTVFLRFELHEGK